MCKASTDLGFDFDFRFSGWGGGGEATFAVRAACLRGLWTCVRHQQTLYKPMYMPMIISEIFNYDNFIHNLTSDSCNPTATLKQWLEMQIRSKNKWKIGL